jgi:hypothetical protein
LSIAFGAMLDLGVFTPWMGANIVGAGCDIQPGAYKKMGQPTVAMAERVFRSRAQENLHWPYDW